MIDIEVLNAIPPDCSYDEWLKVGMALKHEGANCSVWDSWSARGTKYKAGECERKWRTFRRNDVTGGTLHHIAESYGYRSQPDNTVYDIHNLLLDEIIVDPSFVSPERVPAPADNYNAVGDMLEFFTTLFNEDDFVGYCIRFTDEGKPEQSVYRRTAGDIIRKLRESSVQTALGTMNEIYGAYVRFNPLDGKGEHNSNVTRFKHCLVESDTDSIERQYSLFRAMNLPITFLIHSGGRVCTRLYVSMRKMSSNIKNVFGRYTISARSQD